MLWEQQWQPCLDQYKIVLSTDTISWSRERNVAVLDAEIWWMFVLMAITVQLFSQLFKNHIQSI